MDRWRRERGGVNKLHGSGDGVRNIRFKVKNSSLTLGIKKDRGRRYKGRGWNLSNFSFTIVVNHLSTWACNLKYIFSRIVINVNIIIQELYIDNHRLTIINNLGLNFVN